MSLFCVEIAFQWTIPIAMERLAYFFGLSAEDKTTVALSHLYGPIKVQLLPQSQWSTKVGDLYNRTATVVAKNASK